MNHSSTHSLGVFKFILLVCLTFSWSVVFADQVSTIFTFDGNDFIRTSTNLMMEDGNSAVNTILDQDSPAYSALVMKHSYMGDTTLFGQLYEAYYAPLTDSEGNLTGAIFVGNTK